MSDIKRVGLYGITYKEDVDDTRESPTLQLLDKIDGDKPLVFDPMVKKKIVDSQLFDFDQFLNSVDIVVVLVAHTHIKENIDKVKDKIVFDTKNVIGSGVYKL